MKSALYILWLGIRFVAGGVLILWVCTAVLSKLLANGGA